MALILNLETASKNCSVSLSKDSQIISSREHLSAGFSHAEKLHPFIDEVMKEAGVKFTDLDAVAVSKGPGSYTGLRIGVSAAKGLCYANDLPLIAIPTLEIMANSQKSFDGLLVPMLDARRMEVYSSVFNNSLKDSLQEIRSTKAEVIDENSFADILSDNKVLFFGDGAAKCKEVIKSENAHFVDDIYPSSIQMAEMADSFYAKNDFVDVAYFEPFYLKDFIVTKSLKKHF
jgi:tRNA threonylcarbamoyladenosine biosynthesis protein TsaB